MLTPRLPLAIDTRSVTSFDGTEIAYHVTPAPFEGAPWVVLANGLGGPYLAWRGIIDYLGDRYRFITWDYRGLYASGRPAPDGEAAYALPNHVRDIEAILAAEGIARFSLIGWSMGVQVALEAFRRLPGSAQNLVLLNGTHSRPLDGLSPIPGLGRVFSSLVDVGRRAHSIATQMTRHATGQPEAITWLKRFGFIAAALDDAVFGEIVHAFGQLDMEPFFRNLRAISDHDASTVLASIDVPALVITGDRDRIATPKVAQAMAQQIPSAEILVVRGGTHYTAVEYPELVSLRIERFFREHGF